MSKPRLSLFGQVQIGVGIAGIGIVEIGAAMVVEAIVVVVGTTTANLTVVAAQQ